MKYVFLIKLSKAEIAFWYQLENGTPTPLPFEEDLEIPLAFYSSDDKLIMGKHARKQAEENTPKAFDNYFNLIKDPAKKFNFRGEEREIRQLLRFGVEEKIIDFLRNIMRDSEGIISQKQKIALSFCFDCDITDSEKDGVISLFQDAGYKNVRNIEYVEALFEILKNDIPKNSKVLLLNSIYNDLYINYYKSGYRIDAQTVIKEMGEDPHYKLLAKEILKVIQRNNPHVQFDEKKEMPYLLEEARKALEENSPIIFGEVQLSNNRYEYSNILKQTIDKKLNYTDFFSTLKEFVKKQGVGVFSEITLVLDGKINTDYFVNTLKTEFPKIVGINKKTDDASIALLFDLIRDAKAEAEAKAKAEKEAADKAIADAKAKAEKEKAEEEAATKAKAEKEAAEKAEAKAKAEKEKAEEEAATKAKAEKEEAEKAEAKTKAEKEKAKEEAATKAKAEKEAAEKAEAKAKAEKEKAEEEAAAKVKAEKEEADKAEAKAKSEKEKAKEEATDKTKSNTEDGGKGGKSKYIMWLVLIVFVATGIFFFLPSKQTIDIEIPADLEGKWLGTFDGRKAYFTIKKIDKNKIDAEISVKYANQIDESLSGEVGENKTFLFKDAGLNNGKLDGEYNGSFNADFTEFSGNYQDSKTKKTIAFQFRKDYTSEMDTLKAEADAAFDKGDYDEAYNLYAQATDLYPPSDHSNSIKEVASLKFKEKAEQLIQLVGCDATSKKLLTYSNQLHPSSEIDDLLKKCP